MSRLTGTIIVIGVLLSPALTLGEEWIEGQAVYITRPSEKSSVKLREEAQNNFIDIPVEIIPGYCAKASSCYPILFSHGKVLSPPLYQSILYSAQYCEIAEVPQDHQNSVSIEDDVWIWCPVREFQERAKIDNATENSSVKSEGTSTCGPLKSTVFGEDEDEEEKVKLRIVGGTEAEPGEFPWMVSLKRGRGTHFCSGSLLDENVVLLAAHCISYLRSSDIASLQVHIGDHNLSIDEESEHQTRNISAVIYHANFSMRSVYDDIGLLVLSEPVIFSDNIAPICLPAGENEESSPDFEDGSTFGLIAGWGQPGEYLRPLSVLHKALVKIWKRDECEEKYRGKLPGGTSINQKMICAGSNHPDIRDTCKGDSGGPLSLNRDGKVEQVGITSFGIGCGLYPGVFTRLQNYLLWVEENRNKAKKYFSA